MVPGVQGSHTLRQLRCGAVDVCVGDDVGDPQGGDPARGRPRPPAWLAFHRAARQDPSAVTIWHETYAVSAAESLYAGPAPFGLADVGGTGPVGRRGETARERIVRR